MTTKQAARSKAKKALRRKRQVAERRREAEPGWDMESLYEQPSRDGYGLRPEDYLPSGMVKASAALMAIARPICDIANIREGENLRFILMLVMLAWNLEVHGGDGEDEILRKLTFSAGSSTDQYVPRIFEYARSAKRTLFPQDQRLLCDLAVEDLPGGPRLHVATMVPTP